MRAGVDWAGHLDAGDVGHDVLVVEARLHLGVDRPARQRELQATRQRLVLRVGRDEGAVAGVDQRAHLHELRHALVGADEQQVQALDLDCVVGRGGLEDRDVRLLAGRITAELEWLLGGVVDVLVPRDGDVHQVGVAVDVVEGVATVGVRLGVELADRRLLLATEGQQQDVDTGRRAAVGGLVDHLAADGAVEQVGRSW
jgi:hypothetical protein